MKRNEAIKKIGQIYGINIQNSDLACVGNIKYQRETNILFDKTISTYNFLFCLLYSNKARLKDLTAIYEFNNTIYFDLKYLRGNELLDLRKEEVKK